MNTQLADNNKPIFHYDVLLTTYKKTKGEQRGLFFNPLNAYTFTLIEMLIVIAIIAILASMLIPSVQKTLASVRLTYCMNNTKQIGYGVILYSENYSGTLPPDGIYNRNGGTTRSRNSWWPCLIYTYATGSEQPGNGSRTPIYWNFTGSDFKSNLFCCPQMPEEYYSSEYIYIEGKVSYGMNYMEFSSNPSTGKSWFTKISSVPQPGSTIWATDSFVTSSGFSILMDPGWRSYYPAPRHLGWGQGTDRSLEFSEGNPGRANAFFLDGHNESIDFSVIRRNQQNLFRIKKK